MMESEKNQELKVVFLHDEDDEIFIHGHIGGKKAKEIYQYYGSGPHRFKILCNHKQKPPEIRLVHDGK